MALDKKQKILIPIIVIAVIYVAWQLWSMFGGDSGSTPSATPQSQPKTAAVNVASSGGNSAGQAPAGATMGSSAQSAVAPAAATSTGAAAMQPSSMPQPQAAVVAQPALTPVQAQYLDLSNQYQIARMQRMLLDQQAAIAQARERILKLDQSLRDSGVSIGQDLGSSVYRLAYIGYQAGRWRAAINFSGRFFVVGIGDTLPNGATVSRISNAGVVLDVEGEQILLTTLGNHTIKEQQAAQPAMGVQMPAANMNSISQEMMNLQRSFSNQSSNMNQPNMPPQTATKPMMSSNDENLMMKSETKPMNEASMALSNAKNLPPQTATKPMMPSNGENLMMKPESKPVMPPVKPVAVEKTTVSTAPEAMAKMPSAMPAMENSAMATAETKMATTTEMTAAAKPAETKMTMSTAEASNSMQQPMAESTAAPAAANETASKPLTIEVPNKNEMEGTEMAPQNKPKPAMKTMPMVAPVSQKPTAQPLPALQKIDVDMSPTPPTQQPATAMPSQQPPAMMANATMNANTAMQKTTTTQQQVPLTAHEEKTFKDLKQFIKSENHQVQQKAASSETKSMAQTNALLLKVPGNHYTIQLMGGRSRSALRQLIAANHLNQAHVFRTFYLGKEWFVLIDGNYKTADQARQALGQLPDNLKRLNPWVRPMASVHQAIKLYH